MKTAGQYKHERDQLQRRADALEDRLVKAQREIMDHNLAMRAMQHHNQLVVMQMRDADPDSHQYHRLLGWKDAIRCFSNEVQRAASD